MNETMKVIGMLVLAVALGFGGWYFKRYINYSFNYESQVTDTIKKEITPLQERIKILEKRISLLEGAK